MSDEYRPGGGPDRDPAAAEPETAGGGAPEARADQGEGRGAREEARLPSDDAEDQPITRREVVLMAGAGAVSGIAGFTGGRRAAPLPLGDASVAILQKAAYKKEDLMRAILAGARACGLNPAGQRVLLKPLMMGSDPESCINTHPLVVAAAVEAFTGLGAARVTIGEGPDHHRDTFWLAEAAGYASGIPGFEELFVDLNRDDVREVQGFGDQERFYFPVSVLEADLVVSLGKMKTHHYTGVAAAMHNLWGTVPGAVYGWPKNALHYMGIPEALVALAEQFRPGFAIVDGITGMEGNGLREARPKQSGVLVIGADLAAVDATCCRIMGIDPGAVEYLRLAAGRAGVIEERRIHQVGAAIAEVRSDYQLMDGFEDQRLPS